MSVASTTTTSSPDQVSLCPLARALVQHQMLRADQAVALQRKASAAAHPFIDELVAHGPVSSLRLARFAAETWGHPWLDLSALALDQLPADLIDRKLALETRVLALGRRGSRLSVAISDPTDQAALDRIKFQTQASIDPIIVEHDKLVKLVEKAGRTASQQLSDMVDETLDLELASDEPAPATESTEVDDAPVVRFLQQILMDAINAGASDLHFEPYEKYYRIRVRVDG